MPGVAKLGVLCDPSETYPFSVQRSVETYVQGILSGNRVVLGQAITLIESTRPDHQALAQKVIQQLLHESESGSGAQSVRIAVTGAPGVGKSSFIEAIGMHLVTSGKKVAVLAIDPSSALSKGSILGDKTRMEQLAASEQAFIRPSAAGTSLGGVARKTRETILLVEAAGYDTVFIETVGVGQSETAVHRMTDIFLLLLLPGAGDELQGIKRGIVEMADILAVNKADGDRLKLANQARAHYLNATHLLPPKTSAWAPKVLTCSAQDGTGIEAVWQAAEAFLEQVQGNGFFEKNRRLQARYWLEEAIDAGIKARFYDNPDVLAQRTALEPEVLAERMSPFAAAEALLQAFFKTKKT